MEYPTPPKGPELPAGTPAKSSVEFANKWALQMKEEQTPKKIEGKPPKTTVKRKLAIGVATILLAVPATGGFAYLAVDALDKEIQQRQEQMQPYIDAHQAREEKIQANETELNQWLETRSDDEIAKEELLQKHMQLNPDNPQRAIDDAATEWQQTIDNTKGSR